MKGPLIQENHSKTFVIKSMQQGLWATSVMERSLNNSTNECPSAVDYERKIKPTLSSKAERIGSHTQHNGTTMIDNGRYSRGVQCESHITHQTSSIKS